MRDALPDLEEAEQEDEETEQVQGWVRKSTAMANAIAGEVLGTGSLGEFLKQMNGGAGITQADVERIEKRLGKSKPSYGYC